jgi:hypothetical protein
MIAFIISPNEGVETLNFDYLSFSKVSKCPSLKMKGKIYLSTNHEIQKINKNYKGEIQPSSVRRLFASSCSHA